MRIAGGRWLAIRPGTDGALALAMIQVVVEEQLYDRNFVERWTAGFEELKSYAARFTPEKAEAITGIPAEQIRDAARDIARARGACFLYDSGLEFTNSGVQNIRAVLILEAITGNYDVPGATLINIPPWGFWVNRSRRLSPPEGRIRIGADRYPLYTLFRREAQAMELPRAILEGKPYPIRALLIIGASILTAYPDPELWRRSLEKLEFVMVVDRFPTEDALYADIVLPATTAFEHGGYIVKERRISLRRQVIEPPGEARCDWDACSAGASFLSFDSRRFNKMGQEFVVEDRGDGKGLGVYALRTYGRGERIAVVSGEIVGEHRLLHTLQLTAHTHLYDPAFTGCLLHSCDPNAIIDPAKREVTALKDIGIDEAITVDYAHTEDRLVKQFACMCGSSNCRRWIKGRKEEITQEGRQYLDRFQPG